MKGNGVQTLDCILTFIIFGENQLKHTSKYIDFEMLGKNNQQPEGE